MAKFKLPPVSPLLGSNFHTFFKTLSYGGVDPVYYLKLAISFIVVLVGAPFRKYDYWYYSNLIKRTQKIQDPVFIIGHWRSGTTFLHNILTRDNIFGFVTTYQSVFPNNLIARFIFRRFMKARIPTRRPGDNVKLAVNFPQEDEFALSNMNPYTYYQFMYLPEQYAFFYDNFIRLEKNLQVEKLWMNDYERMIRKALFNTNGQIPLLKNPCNTGRIPTLLKLFPNARFIHIIRNPVTIFLSARKFYTELLPTLWLHRVDKEFIESMILDIYEKIMKDFLLYKNLIPEQNYLEFKFEDFEREPINYLEDIYTKFEIGAFEKRKTDFEQYIESMSEYRKNKYEKIQEGVLNMILEKWGFAMELWDYKVPDNIQVIKEKAMDHV